MNAATVGTPATARCALPRGFGSRRARGPSPARRLVFAAALALLSALAAGAQSARPEAAEAAETAEVADAAQLGELSLTELMALKVTTVRGASRYEQSLRDAPSSVTIVTDDEIRKHGYRTLAEVLRSVRGIHVRYDRNYSYIGVRGFDRAGDWNSRILLLVDGHRVEENVGQSNYIGTDFPVDTGLIDHVEVIRGPGSALYGSNAFSAVVNVVSKSARQVGAGSATVGGGSFDTYKGGFAVAGRSTAGIEYLASASALHSRGPARLYFPEFDAPESHGGIVAGADGDEARNVAAKVSYQGLSLEAIYGWRRKGIPTASYETVFGDTRGETVDSTGFLDLGYNHESAGGLSTQVHLNLTRQTYDGVYIYDDAEPGEPAALVRNIDEQVGQWFGAELLFAKRLAQRHRLIAGAELRDNTQQEAANFDQEPRFVYSRTVRQSKNWGLFLQDEVALHPQLSLTAGLRHDYYPRFGGTTNPRLALIYRPWPTTVVKALYGEAFRAPSLYETDWADPASKPNSALLPEKIATTEIVYERQLPASFLLSVSAYRSRIEDLIGQQTDPEDGLLVNGNLDDAELRGVELELARNLPNGLEGRISWAFQRSTDELSGRALENSPRQLGKLVLSVPLHRDALFLGLDAQYSSAVETVRVVRVDGYWLANATLSARPTGRRFEVALSFYNLFDESYAYAVGDEHVQDTIPQDGRTFDLRLTYRF